MIAKMRKRIAELEREVARLKPMSTAGMVTGRHTGGVSRRPSRRAEIMARRSVDGFALWG